MNRSVKQCINESFLQLFIIDLPIGWFRYLDFFKALPLIATNSKAKKKGAHCEHLNYHSLSMLISDCHPLFSDALSSRIS